MHKICVVGAGHVGLVAAAGFAELKHKVVCVDNNPGRIAALKKMAMPFYEPGLEKLVKKNFKSQQQLRLSTSIQTPQRTWKAFALKPQAPRLRFLILRNQKPRLRAFSAAQASAPHLFSGLSVAPCIGLFSPTLYGKGSN